MRLSLQERREMELALLAQNLHATLRSRKGDSRALWYTHGNREGAKSKTSPGRKERNRKFTKVLTFRHTVLSRKDWFALT